MFYLTMHSTHFIHGYMASGCSGIEFSIHPQACYFNSYETTDSMNSEHFNVFLFLSLSRRSFE